VDCPAVVELDETEVVVAVAGEVETIFPAPLKLRYPISAVGWFVAVSVVVVVVVPVPVVPVVPVPVPVVPVPVPVVPKVLVCVCTADGVKTNPYNPLRFESEQPPW
jgi:hypothetical protein